ncbi:protein trichome birefringence [Salix suchowensis]|nr:protein trichome birefringence [Salix suchowensis]
MVKEMRSDLNPFSLLKHNNVIIKFAASALLVGLAFRLLISDSFRFYSVVETSVPANEETKPESLMASMPAEEPAPNDFQANKSRTSQSGKCDLFTGEWVPDPSGPVYTNQSCFQIEGHQNCMKNGRPDSGYLYWRWSPRGCSLPRFKPKKFLHLMRNKSWAFIGDSISRNHVQSLLCILSQEEQAVETYHDEEYRSKIWHFPTHNFTLSVIWTPFLIKADIFEDMNGVSSSEIQLHLDELDRKWTDQYRSFDYAIIAGGKWFLKTAIYHENNVVTGCHYCPGKNLTELGFDYAYRKALQLVFNFITSSGHNTLAFLRTTTPDHFENGEWFSGGTCNRKVPFKEDGVNMTDVDTIMRNIELEEFAKAAALGPEKRVVLKLLDTTRLSLLRPDGHPGPYRQFQPFAGDKKAKVQNDCLHWCLPGPIDSGMIW